MIIMPKGHGYKLERYKGYSIVRTDNDRIHIYYGNIEVFKEHTSTGWIDSITGAKNFLDGFTKHTPRWMKQYKAWQLR